MNRLVPAGPAKAWAEQLHSGGMSIVQIATAAHTSKATVTELLAGYRNGKPHSGRISSNIAAAILAVPLTPYSGRYGAVYPVHGVHRRLQALEAAGYPQTFMSGYLGYAPSAEYAMGALLTNGYTHRSTWEQVDAMYAKLRYTDPVDAGVAPEQKSRAIARGRRKGYAPPGAWDDDMIDDPTAEPEWTGACGSMGGVRLHRKYGIPLCPACKEVRRRVRRPMTISITGPHGDRVTLHLDSPSQGGLREDQLSGYVRGTELPGEWLRIVGEHVTVRSGENVIPAACTAEYLGDDLWIIDLEVGSDRGI